MINTLAKDIVMIHKRDSSLYSTAEEQVEYLIGSYSKHLVHRLSNESNCSLRYDNLVISKTRLSTALNNPIHKTVLYRKCQELLQMNSLQGIL